MATLTMSQSRPTSPARPNTPVAAWQQSPPSLPPHLRPTTPVAPASAWQDSLPPRLRRRNATILGLGSTLLKDWIDEEQRGAAALWIAQWVARQRQKKEVLAYARDDLQRRRVHRAALWIAQWVANLLRRQALVNEAKAELAVLREQRERKKRVKIGRIEERSARSIQWWFLARDPRNNSARRIARWYRYHRRRLQHLRARLWATDFIKAWFRGRKARRTYLAFAVRHLARARRRRWDSQHTPHEPTFSAMTLTAPSAAKKGPSQKISLAHAIWHSPEPPSISEILARKRDKDSQVLKRSVPSYASPQATRTVRNTNTAADDDTPTKPSRSPSRSVSPRDW